MAVGWVINIVVAEWIIHRMTPYELRQTSERLTIPWEIGAPPAP